MRKVYLREEKLFVLRKIKESFFGFGALCMKEFYEGIILINIGTSYLLLFQYFSHGLLFLETSHMTFPTKVIVQNEATQRL